MGKIINEQSFINQNIFQYEERLNSQFTRILATKPTYVTYFHINNISSTTDVGFENVERLVGVNSPIRFNEVKDFPIHGLERIGLDLEQTEYGLDVNYESDGVILPNTVQPFVDDLFIINYLNKPYLFRISNIKYDTIKSNNFYGITFYLLSTDHEMIDQVYKQISDKYTCDIMNVGTDRKSVV